MSVDQNPEACRAYSVRGLYIHIPFCISKCGYCDFYSIPSDEYLMDRYVDALCRDLAARADSVIDIATIYIGGGTPTVLRDEQLLNIIRVIRENYRVAPGVEFTMEANPGTLTPAKAEPLLAEGVNRISIGIQSFADNDLRLLRRAHNTSDALKAVWIVRDAGCANISLDLIYGIPHQTCDEWQKVLGQALHLRPQHISAYELTAEEGTPLNAAIVSGTVAMPTEESIVKMHDILVEMTAAQGYEHYEISNFALPGFRCRHNLNYWNRGDYIGIGAAAHSCVGNARSSNFRDVHRYIDAVSRGLPPTEERCELSDVEVMSEYIFLGLRKAEGIDIGRLPADKILSIRKAVDQLHGLVILDGSTLRLTKRGVPLSNEVIVRVM